MEKIKKIGVLTSGGDAPGMNAAIRAITDKALEQGIEVVGVIGGYRGLIDNKIIPLTSEFVNSIVGLGGTKLYSDRCNDFKTEEGMQKAIDTCKKNNIDAIIAIGGDGTFRGATDLSLHGIPAIGVTGTIDNDITATDYTVGFDTAMNTVLGALERFADTCESHARCNVVEVMGRRAGFLALNAGIAVGATSIIVPEIEAIRTERLFEFEEQGIQVVPSARAVNYTMNRRAIRDLASRELGLRTAKYVFAKTFEEFKKAADEIGFPCVVKPLMSSSGHGQSYVHNEEELEIAFK